MFKPESFKEKKNMSEKLENKDKIKNYQIFQTPDRNPSLMFDKVFKPYDVNRNYGQKLTKKTTFYDQKKETIKIMNKKLSFSENISIIHYCRLCYKYGCVINDQVIIDSQARTFFLSWSIQLLL